MCKVKKKQKKTLEPILATDPHHGLVVQKKNM